MKNKIHPKYYPNATVICACGNTWTTGSTKEEIHTDVCFQCHPFFTGEQRIVDTEGQVDRFYKKLQARQEFLDDKAAKEAEQVSPDRLIIELELGTRATNALENEGITNVGHALDRLATGEEAMLSIDGFGRKSLADLKKRLRQFGYEIPEAAEEISV